MSDKSGEAFFGLFILIVIISFAVYMILTAERKTIIEHWNCNEMVNQYGRCKSVDEPQQVTDKE